MISQVFESNHDLFLRLLFAFWGGALPARSSVRNGRNELVCCWNAFRHVTTQVDGWRQNDVQGGAGVIRRGGGPVALSGTRRSWGVWPVKWIMDISLRPLGFAPPCSSTQSMCFLGLQTFEGHEGVLESSVRFATTEYTLCPVKEAFDG